MSATAPNNITPPAIVAEIANRAARAIDDDLRRDMHHRVAQALGALASYTDDGMRALVRALGTEALAYTRFHFRPIVERHPVLRDAARERAQEIDEVTKANRWRWERAIQATE